MKAMRVGQLMSATLLLGALTACEQVAEQAAPAGTNVKIKSRNAEAAQAIEQIVGAYGPVISAEGEVKSLPNFTYNDVAKVEEASGKRYLQLASLDTYASETIFTYAAPPNTKPAYSPLVGLGSGLSLTGADATAACQSAVFTTEAPRLGDLPRVPGEYTFCIRLEVAAKVHAYLIAPPINIKPNRLWSGSLAINGGSALTSSEKVKLALTADSAKEMYITSEAGCTAGGQWERFAASKDWTLSALNSRVAVYAKFKDEAGTESTCASASILHDSIGPQQVSLTINFGAAFTSGISTSLTITAQDATEMYITNTAGCGSNGSWEAFASSKRDWNIAETNATATVYAKFMDAAGNESACVSDSIIHDTIAPSSNAVTIAGGAAYTMSSTVALTLTTSDASEMYITNVAGCTSGGSWESLASSKSGWTLAQTETTATVYAKFRDTVGNESACVADTIIHDATPPSSPAISIAGAETYTTSSSVALTLAAAGASAMYITNTAGCSSGGSWEAFATSKSAWSLGQTNATATVYVKFKDAAGNESLCASDTIIHDAQAPTSVGLTVNNGAAYTTSTAVSLTLTATDASEMFVTATSGCNSGASWEAYAASKAWTLTQTNATATVYAKFRDAAGNESSCLLASIIHDDQAPTSTSLSIQGGVNYITTTSTNLTLAATGASEMYVTNTAGCTADGTWQAYATSKSWTLGQTNATATVYVAFKDAAGNVSACINDTIVHDNTAPSSESISIAAGATYTKTALVDLTLSAVQASEMSITNSLSCSGTENWETYATSKSNWSLAQTNNTATVYVKYRDAAGNVSGCASDTIVHDDTPPSNPGSFTDGVHTLVNSTSPAMSWTASSDAGSGLARYELAIGSSAGASDILTWTSQSTSTSATVNSLTLTSETIYYGSVRAYDNAGNYAEVQGNGFVTGYVAALDTNFNGSGVAVHDSAAGGSSTDLANDIAVQSDGKIVVVGYSTNAAGTPNKDLVVWRYNTNGTLDTSFNSVGYVTHNSAAGGNGDDEGKAVAIQSDGKIVVAGQSKGSNPDFAVWRFNTNGTLDTTFDSDGFRTFNITALDEVFDVAIQSDGKILVTGQSFGAVGSSNDMVVFRLNANGSDDTTFDSDGRYIVNGTAGGNGSDIGYALAVQSDGKIVVAGRSHNGTNNDMCVWRFTTVGALDTTFNTTGFFCSNFGGANGSGHDDGYSLAIDGSGRIVVAGVTSGSGTANDFAIWRLTSAGALDTSFSGDGVFTVDYAWGNDLFYHVLVQSSGKIIATGRSGGGTNNRLMIYRLNDDGTPDTTFAANGFINEPQPSGSNSNYARASVLSGSYLMSAGERQNGTNLDPAVWRYRLRE